MQIGLCIWSVLLNGYEVITFYYCRAHWHTVFQVTCSPVPQSDTPSTSVQKVQRSLKRTARMTPLWRTVGTKPHGAYCQNNYECSTGICRWVQCLILIILLPEDICQNWSSKYMCCSTGKATVPTANRLILKMTFLHHRAQQELDSVSSSGQLNVQRS